MNDFEFDKTFETLEKIVWKESIFENVDWYCCKNGCTYARYSPELNSPLVEPGAYVPYMYGVPS